MSKLVLHIPGGGMRDIPLEDGRITIGRRADNDVCLPYPAVSAEHAAIVTVLDDSFLEDLQSTNGTLVNGKRVAKHFLRDHDAIDLGRVQLVYLVDDDEVIAPLETEVAVPDASGSGEQMTVDNATADVGEEFSAEKPVISIDDGDLASVDHLLAELMGKDSHSAVVVDIPPALSVVHDTRANMSSDREARSEATSGVYIEVMNGPNAGQIVPMTKPEFVLGHKGATKAVIRRDEDRFSLVPVDLATATSVNGVHVRAEGTLLAIGDTIDVGGVLLRFGRRPPL
jgi:FHA domain